MDSHPLGAAAASAGQLSSKALSMPPPTSTSSLSSAHATGALDAAKAERRLKERQKMQRYRQRLVAKMAFLKDTARRMEDQIRAHTLARRSSRTLLPWEHIANALREERDASSLTNATLKQECHDQTVLLQAMQLWVVRATGILPASPTTGGPTWQNVTLSAHPASRKLGFDWITQYLYHNTERTFHDMGFSSGAAISDFGLDIESPECCQYVWRSQRIFPAPLEYVRDVFARPNIAGQLKGSYLGNTTSLGAIHEIEAQDNEALRALNGRYLHTAWGVNVLVHFLAREFHEPNRCIFVAQNIHDDEALPNSALQRNRLIWLVLDRVGPDQTRVRGLCINSHGFDQHGYVNFEDEARRWGCDVTQYPPHLQVTKFAQQVRQIATRNGSSFGQEFQDSLQRTFDRRHRGNSRSGEAMQIKQETAPEVKL
ncbi:Aste57867_18916 [Aphanomyces stellatus]|uniref:Aste57867_18916 protein n=1 Tax=Aphanomyces stellatus TaxID=120398 RepID=A0A485LD08_9STRA|nr:hypothetical protein As57867_018852 [Aphanomyces stellatus]VFT95648.1 Aste57867_18916 [Aphanomyces stellatus]